MIYIDKILGISTCWKEDESRLFLKLPSATPLTLRYLLGHNNIERLDQYFYFRNKEADGETSHNSAIDHFSGAYASVILNNRKGIHSQFFYLLNAMTLLKNITNWYKLLTEYWISFH